MVRAAVAGVGGRMGSRIAQLIRTTKGIELTGSFERPQHPAVGKDAAEILGGPSTGLTIFDNVEQVFPFSDVILDFTNASASLDHLRKAAPAGKAMVIGSTGFSPRELAEVKELARTVPCVQTPNMSVGVNVMFKIVAAMARLLSEGYDVEIIEAHHRYKKDAPSGTAIKLAETVAEVLGRDMGEAGVFARHGIIGERTDREIGIQTIRAGDIVGEHTVLFGGLGERIEITHRAHSRDNFVHGAIRAALWVVEQPPGLYDMRDVLALR